MSKVYEYWGYDDKVDVHYFRNIYDGTYLIRSPDNVFAGGLKPFVIDPKGIDDYISKIQNHKNQR